MTNKTNTFPKLTAAQERAWQLVLDWHKKHGQQIDAFDANLLDRIDGYQVKETTLNALARKGMLIRLSEYKYLYNDYAIHPDFVPEYFDDEPATPAPEPAPAAAPAPVNNAPVEPEAKFKVGDEVYLKDHPQKRIVGTVNNDGTYGLRTMSGGTGWTDYTADQLTPARDASIPFADMNAYERIIMAAAETNARLEARIKELEGDMERVAASELELVQQNALLNSVVDRLGQRAATLETENTELKARLAENHIQTAEERAADWGKWNKGS